MGNRGKLACFQYILVNLLPKSKVLQAGRPGSCSCWETGCFPSWIDWESLRRRRTSLEQRFWVGRELCPQPVPSQGRCEKEIRPVCRWAENRIIVSLLTMSVENQPLVRTNLFLFKVNKTKKKTLWKIPTEPSKVSSFWRARKSSIAGHKREFGGNVWQPLHTTKRHGRSGTGTEKCKERMGW